MPIGVCIESPFPLQAREYRNRSVKTEISGESVHSGFCLLGDTYLAFSHSVPFILSIILTDLLNHAHNTIDVNAK